jgi:hypothetical protein
MANMMVRRIVRCPLGSKCNDGRNVLYVEAGDCRLQVVVLG